MVVGIFVLVYGLVLVCVVSPVDCIVFRCNWWRLIFTGVI